MPESIILFVLAVFFGLGLVLGVVGLRRRSWGLLLIGLVLCSMPLGFASVVMADPRW